MSCGRCRPESRPARLRLMGWFAPKGAAHVVCRGYPESYPPIETLYFLDAYFGYHQIMMKESDQLMTSFIKLFGSFCYVTMPFGLKNARATYQRCMLKCFRDLIGQTVEAYVDDIVLKSKWANQVVVDLEQTFVKL